MRKKSKSLLVNFWRLSREHLNFDFKISEKIEAGFNLMGLSEKLTYRDRILDENILGIDFKYRF